MDKGIIDSRLLAAEYPLASVSINVQSKLPASREADDVPLFACFGKGSVCAGQVEFPTWGV